MSMVQIVDCETHLSGILAEDPGTSPFLSQQVPGVWKGWEQRHRQ